MKRCPALGLLGFLLFSASGLSAQANTDALVRFLRSWVGPADDVTKTTEYTVAFVGLRDDGTSQAVVYLTSGGWCATGGCTLLILEPQGNTYRLVTKIPAMRPPVWLLATKSKGWHDLCILMRAGAGESVFYMTLPFDGSSYPNSTSGPSVRPSDKRVQRTIAIPAGAKGTPLF